MFKKPVKKDVKIKNAGVEFAIKEIQTKYGEGAIMKLGEAPRVDVDSIPTGSLGLDLALGIG
ncbi:MAG: DNA recombination/repair protein RecA, partial [Patescibacteria group bacterium]